MIVLEVQGDRRVQAEHSIRVGRDPDWANLPLDEDLISRHHLEIRPDDRGYRVFDLGSTNGSSVNGKAVGEAGLPVAEGDVIMAGGAVELRVLSVDSPHATAPETKLGATGARLSVELHVDVFVVKYEFQGRIVRDTMAYQLGLALSLLALYQQDGLGPVPDVDLRSFVWRGDREQMQHGDINRLLLRLRKWFQQRGVEPPTIVRPKRAGSTRLDLPASALTILPEGWLYRFLDAP